MFPFHCFVSVPLSGQNVSLSTDTIFNFQTTNFAAHIKSARGGGRFYFDDPVTLPQAPPSGNMYL